MKGGSTTYVLAVPIAGGGGRDTMYGVVQHSEALRCAVRATRFLDDAPVAVRLSATRRAPSSGASRWRTRFMRCADMSSS